MKINMFNEVNKNKWYSIIMFTFFIIIIGFLGAVIGIVYGNRNFGLIIALAVAVIYSLIVYYSGDSMVLSMSGAKPVTKKEYPHLYHTVEGLAIAGGIPTPKCYVINDTALNAFATGKDPKNASIAVTTGLLEKLNRQELEGVIAHEMSHIKNYDIRFMMLTAVLVGVVVLISDFLLRSFLWGGKGNDREGGGSIAIVAIVVGLVFAILAPIIGEIIKLAISRKREYMADANGAILCRNPQSLANALKKISKDPDPLVDTANKATSHLYISIPFRHKGSALAHVFSTHPPIQERIKRLEAM